MNEEKRTAARLMEAGWTEQFVACEPRLSEAAAMYKEAGFDVHLEPLPEVAECEHCIGEETLEACRICFRGEEDQYRIIYTRPSENRPEPDEDLF
jgi:hypothetical protein